MAENTERGAQLWSRLGHEGLGMPIPAVYLPQRSLPADTRGMWGFEPIVTRDAAKPIPYAHRDGLALVADIRGRHDMNVLIVPQDVFTGNGEPARVDDPQFFASGRFAEPHPRKWKRAAYTAQSLLAVIGPDDVPSLNPEKLRGLDPMNARDLGRGVSTLWIFNSAIAALHLIRP
jgi:hypothetical protein